MADPLPETASQTAGPYVHIGCLPQAAGLGDILGPQDLGTEVMTGAAKGARITIAARIFDGQGAPVTDAMVEVWQADHAGLFNSPQETRGQADPAFHGWARRATDAQGMVRLDTIKPGRVPWQDGRLQAPHVALWITARGINLGLHTRLYFADDKANTEDPMLAAMTPAQAQTLLAARDGDTYRHDIYLQGERETVFLDV